MKPRYSIYHSPSVKPPDYAVEVCAALRIEDVSDRTKALRAVNKRWGIRTERVTASTSSDAPPVGAQPISEESFRRKHDEIKKLHPNQRLQPLKNLRWEYTVSNLTPESQATFRELRRLESDPRYSERLAAWKKANVAELRIAYAEASRIPEVRVNY